MLQLEAGHLIALCPCSFPKCYCVAFFLTEFFLEKRISDGHFPLPSSLTAFFIATHVGLELTYPVLWESARLTTTQRHRNDHPDNWKVMKLRLNEIFRLIFAMINLIRRASKRVKLLVGIERWILGHHMNCDFLTVSESFLSLRFLQAEIQSAGDSPHSKWNLRSCRARQVAINSVSKRMANELSQHM